MLKRLLENWLDSASERSYQSPFCQILSAKGYTILHSTRHGALEFGKDVIAFDSDGTLCAFQLKGNPGTRLSLAQFKQIQNQLVQLVTQPVVFPGISIQPFNAYLVTNGIVDEEVQRAIDDLNRSFGARAIGRPISVIQRGQILRWLEELGLIFWPSELTDVNKILKFLVTDGGQIFPTERLHDLLSNVLLLDSSNKKRPSANEIKRRVTSAALLTAMCLKNFSSKVNHYAIISGWVMFSTYVIAACQKHGKSYKRNASHAVEIACEAIFLSLSQLCREITERKHYVEGDPLVDCFVYRSRLTLLVALMGIYWFWSEKKGWLDDKHKDFITKFIASNSKSLELWGEAAIPQFLVYYWHLRTNDPSVQPDQVLASLLSEIARISSDEKSNGLPSPYYGFEEITNHRLRKFLHLKEDPFQGDSFRFSSYYALSLMHLLVRTNLKQTCKAIWPDFSRLNFKHFEPPQSWMYCLKESPEGTEVIVQPKLTKDWVDLVDEARDIKVCGVPDALKKNEFLLTLFIILFPFRGTPAVLRYLGWKFNKCWMIDKPIK